MPYVLLPYDGMNYDIAEYLNCNIVDKLGFPVSIRCIYNRAVESDFVHVKHDCYN